MNPSDVILGHPGSTGGEVTPKLYLYLLTTGFILTTGFFFVRRFVGSTGRTASRVVGGFVDNFG